MISKTILRYFPPPAFLKTPYAGLSMSDAHIRIIQFESGSAGLRIKTYAALPLPQGAITSGRVNNPEQIIGVLKELREKTGISYVRVSIPEEKAYLFETELPEVDPKEIRNAIGFKLEDNVPLPADQIIFDYATVAESLNSVNAIVSALPAKFVQIYVDLFLGAGFVPYVFEIESQAIARALLHPADLDTYLIMHVSLGKIQICIASLRLVHFTSTVNPSRDWQEDPESVISELSKITVFWRNSRANLAEGKKPVEKILLSGDTVSASCITTMTDSLKMEVIVGNVWTNAFDVNTAAPEISFGESLQYTAAIGLALPSESLI